MKRLAVILCLCVCLAGCPMPPVDPPSPVEPTEPDEVAVTGNYSADSRAAAVAYSKGLGAGARTIASEIRSGKIKTNADAFKRFSDLTAGAKLKFNASWGKAANKRNPPDGPVDATAWDEAAKGWESVK